MLTSAEVQAGADHQRLTEMAPASGTAAWAEERLALRRPRRRRKTVSTEMMVHVTVRCPDEPTVDQISVLTRNINGEVSHSKYTGLLEIRWRVPSERLLGVVANVPRVLSQTLTTAFRDEPEVVSLNVTSMAKQ